MNTAALPRPIPSVMVIDDDEFSCEVMSEMLTAQGVTEIHTASNGHHALDILAGLTSPPDMMICDVFMDNMDGIELMAALASQHYQGQVVLVSGVDAQMLTVAQTLALANGINLRGSYQKPMQRATLAAVLQQLD